MPILPCPLGNLLIDNVVEALHRQCELPAQPASPEEIALEMEIAEAVKATCRHATDHFSTCPICRSG
jgi:hypothetical protein